MGEFAGLAQGLSFISSFVPVYGTAIALAATAIGALDGPPDAVVPNPLLEPRFTPRAVLWGIRQTTDELLRGHWTNDFSGGPITKPLEDVAKIVNGAINVEVLRRGDPSRLIGRHVLINLGRGLDPNFRSVRVTGGGPIAAPEFMRLEVYNRVIAEWKARIEAHGEKDPVFGYIDTRPWSEVAIDEAHDSGAGKPEHSESARTATDLAGKIRDYQNRRTPAAIIAYNAWKLKHEEALERYNRERAAWREWHRSLALEKERAAAQQQVVQRFNETWNAWQAGVINQEQAITLSVSPLERVGVRLVDELRSPSSSIAMATATAPKFLHPSQTIAGETARTSSVGALVALGAVALFLLEAK